MLGQEAEQGRAGRLAEPPGVPDQVLIGEVGVGPRDRHTGEVIHLGQRVLEVDHGQQPGQRSGFGVAQRPHRLVPVQDDGRDGQVGGGRAGLRQVEPAHHRALERQGQVVDGMRPVGQPEVEDAGYPGVRRGRGPGEVGGVPVAVPPLRGEHGQQRRDVPDQRNQARLEVRRPGPSGQVGGQRGPRGHQPTRRGERVGRADDLAGVHQHPGRTGGQAEVRRGQVQAGQRRAGRVGVAEAGVRGPADRVAVQVDAVRDLVGLVAEFPAPQHGLPVGQPQHFRDRLSPHAQVTGEGVFGRELGGGADAEVVALDEDGRIAVPDQRGGGHRARAAPRHHGLAAQAARVTGPAQDPAQLAVRQRGPVGFGQLTAHAVDGVRPKDGKYPRVPRSGAAFAHRSPVHSKAVMIRLLAIGGIIHELGH